MSSQNAKDHANDLYSKWRMLQSKFREIHETLIHISTDMKAEEFSRTELCDIGYICREISRLSDELRKDANARMDFAGMLISKSLIQESVSNPNVEDIVRGKLARCSTDVVVEVNLPKYGTVEFQKVAEHYNLPLELFEEGIVKLNWKGISKLATKLAEEGKEMPEGLDSTRTRFTAVYTKSTK